jgi:hypothetical protein
VKRDPPPHPREQRAEDDERRDRLPREHITTFSPDPEKATGAARKRRTENFFLKKRKAAACPAFSLARGIGRKQKLSMQ